MKTMRGMTLMDVVVGTAIVLVIFVSLVGVLRASVMVTGIAKARAGATTIADTQVEYIRALDYDLVGTVGGIPSGVVLATSTQVRNGILYTTRTLIRYVDDSADGYGAADTNGITTDYKQVKVEVSYTLRGQERSVAIISHYAPANMETTTGGGTLSIAVVNAVGAVVPGATVTIANSSTNPTISLTTFSDALGLVQLPGAPTSTQYRVEVSKSGYSSATTYVSTSENPDPTPGYLTVAKDQTTTGTFAIDVLAPFTLRTLHPILPAATSDTFVSSANVENQTNTQVSGGALTLALAGSGYALTGSARQTPVSPEYLANWSSVSATLQQPAGTTASIHVLGADGALLPESELPGNGVGFSSFPISLGTLSTTTHTTLALSVDFTTNSTTTTASVQDWRIDYRVGPTPFPNVAFTLTGAKLQGNGGPAKTVISSTTDSTGVFSSLLEWDVYSISTPGYVSVTASSTPEPYTVEPGTAFSASRILE